MWSCQRTNVHKHLCERSLPFDEVDSIQLCMFNEIERKTKFFPYFVYLTMKSGVSLGSTYWNEIRFWDGSQLNEGSMASHCLTHDGLVKDSHFFSIYVVGCSLYAFFKTNGRIFCFKKEVVVSTMAINFTNSVKPNHLKKLKLKPNHETV